MRWTEPNGARLPSGHSTDGSLRLRECLADDPAARYLHTSLRQYLRGPLVSRVPHIAAAGRLPVAPARA